MGSKKRRAHRRTSTASSKDRFPVGELATERGILREECLSESKKLTALKKRLHRCKSSVSFIVIIMN